MFGFAAAAGLQLLTGALFGNSERDRQRREFERAKQLATYKQELDQKSGQFALGLREQEAQSNYVRDIDKTNLIANIDKDKAGYTFGYNTKLAGQQIEGVNSLENIRQNATTQRQTSQLASQQFMQQAGFNQQNDLFGRQRAGALRGLR